MAHGRFPFLQFMTSTSADKPSSRSSCKLPRKSDSCAYSRSLIPARSVEGSANDLDFKKTCTCSTLSNHGIPQRDIDDAFALSKAFFDLPDEIKARTSHNGKNMGWEKMAQIRPSTGTADQKESMQLQFARMEGMWPSEDDLPGFRERAEKFMAQVQEWVFFTRARVAFVHPTSDMLALALFSRLSVRVMSCLAEGLGLPSDIFEKGTVDPGMGDSQSTLRLLHYHATEGKDFGPNFWRAGAHTDFDVLTMLFQRPGEGGLEVCPGRKAVGDFAIGSVWTPVPARGDIIVCNLGDQMMRWSDDALKSNFHRVKLPGPKDSQGPRYSIAFFNQARSGTVIQGPLKKYPQIVRGEFYPCYECVRRS